MAEALDTFCAAVLETNLAAIAQLSPKTVEAVRLARPPASARLVEGRDGRPTVAWTDEQGGLRWLGRTSMPSIRAAALLDSFQAGSGNTLLVGLGQGAEARLLLDRVAPHQAVMVVESEAWAVRSALTLYDFSVGARLGRFAIFTGTAAWDDLRQFLIDHPGYLSPDRILSWPWFDASAVADATERLAEISKFVAAQRAAKRLAAQQGVAGDADREPRATHETRRGAVAIFSNVSDRRIRDLARRLSIAAEATGRASVCCVLERPDLVHPDAVADALRKARPAVCVLLDTVAAASQPELPACPAITLVSHREPLSADWLAGLPASSLLGVRTAAQHRQATDAGIAESRVVLVPPAAMPFADPARHNAHEDDSASRREPALPFAEVSDSARPTGAESAPRSESSPRAGSRAAAGPRIMIYAEGADVSAEAVGLHLASHVRLWNAAADVLRQRTNDYHDEGADDVLAAAERKTSTRLDSEEVRAGLVERIRCILGPVLVRAACCTAVAKAGLDFDLYGGGWDGDPLLAPRNRGPWPQPDALAHVLTKHDLIITIDTSGRVPVALLDGLAAGSAGIARAHPDDAASDGLGAFVDPDQHVWRFRTPAELVSVVKRFVVEPGAFRERATAAARYVAAHHTWVQRLEAILRACGVLA